MNISSVLMSLSAGDRCGDVFQSGRINHDGGLVMMKLVKTEEKLFVNQDADEDKG